MKFRHLLITAAIAVATLAQPVAASPPNAAMQFEAVTHVARAVPTSPLISDVVTSNDSIKAAANNLSRAQAHKQSALSIDSINMAAAYAITRADSTVLTVGALAPPLTAGNSLSAVLDSSGTPTHMRTGAATINRSPPAVLKNADYATTMSGAASG